MKRTTALFASATIIAAGIATAGSVTYASQDAQQAASPTPHQFKYTFPATSGVSSATFTFPGLANRIYNASFSVLARMSTRGAIVSCSFVRPGGSFQLLQYGSAFSSSTVDHNSTVSASGSLDLRASNPIRFHCFASAGTFTVDNASRHSSVTFVQMGTTEVRSMVS
jgi:hypothetical protein